MCGWGGLGGKGQRSMPCTLSRGERAWRPGRECGCPVRGHTVEGEAERCYTGNVPCETRLLHMRPMRNPGVAWGVDSLKH